MQIFFAVFFFFFFEMNKALKYLTKITEGNYFDELDEQKQQLQNVNVSHSPFHLKRQELVLIFNLEKHLFKNEMHIPGGPGGPICGPGPIGPPMWGPGPIGPGPIGPGPIGPPIGPMFICLLWFISALDKAFFTSTRLPLKSRYFFTAKKRKTV